ncbi:MAG: hypothetical protein AAFO69_14335 [Bacteroidota bacterium]
MSFSEEQIDLFDRYQQKKMSQEEQLDFEKQLERSVELQALFEDYKELVSSLNQFGGTGFKEKLPTLFPNLPTFL